MITGNHRSSLPLLLGLSLPVLLPVASAAADPAPKRILALYWYGRDFPHNDTFDEKLREIFQSQPNRIEYYAEYLESNRFPGEGQALALRDYLHSKFAGLRIDVAIANSAVSLAFLLDYRDDLIPNTPIIVFSNSAGSKVREQARQLGAIEVLATGRYRETLQLALSLHPHSRQVFVIFGMPVVPGFPHGGASIEMDVRKELQEFENRVSVHYLADLPLGELIGRVRHLDRDSLILYIRQSQDAPGQVLSPSEVLPLLAESATVPIYGMSDTFIGRGVVGGYVTDIETGALRTAEVALRVANGAPPESAVIESPIVPMFDWRQLQRWQIQEAKLPANSMILFREPTLWEQFKWQITTALAVGLMLVLLIGVLLVERQRRRRDAEVLRTTNAMLTGSMAEIKHLSGRLMSAQEDERRRISRELHDDVSQQIALLGMRLSTLKRTLSSPVATQENLTALQNDVMRLANSIHTMSHELHPALLERAGLPAALRAHVEEFGGLHGVRIHFDEALVRTVPHEVGLCLYRITQEALRNVVRHSGAKEVWISVGDVNGHIELAVRDFGRGFDPQSVRGTGIGLASMRERARLVGGMVEISSRPGEGTTTRVLIPVSRTVAANV